MRLRFMALVTTVLVAFMSFVAAQESAKPIPGLEQAQAIAKADTGVGQYFTAAQALRGKELFNRHCGYCHYIDPAKMPTMSGIRGGALGPRMILHAADGVARYPSAYYLFKRMEYMPPNDNQSITRQQRADILAYVLQQNGLASGASELTAEDSAMKAMPLPVEPGFAHIFNGRDFTGLQFLFGYHCTAPPEGCGKTDPAGNFSIKDGVLNTTGQIQGMVYWPKKYKNFTLRFEQRVALPWDDLDDLIQDQAGILVFINSKGGQFRPWPDTMLEIEGKYHELLRVSALGGIKIDATLDSVARRHAMNPVNQWQRIEIVSKDGVITCYLNGTLVSTAKLLEDLPPGYIAMQSQGGPIEWRNIRLKEE